MDRLCISQNLKALWEEDFRRLFEGACGTVITATWEQKQWIKERLLAEKGGVLGWHFYTRAQAQRRLAHIGRWELEVLGKSYCNPNLWPGVGIWAAELEAWLAAGYTTHEIPWAAPWQQLTATVFERLTRTRYKLTCQTSLHADVVVGFDPLDTRQLQAHAWGLLIESEEVTAAQEMQIHLLEKTAGAAHWCDTGELIKRGAVAVDCESELAPAIQQALENDKNIKRLIYRGAVAQAAAESFANPSKQSSWQARQSLEKIKNCALVPEGFDGRWSWLKQQVASGFVAPEELKRLQKQAGQKWEDEGILDKEVLPAVLPPLPEEASPTQMAAACQAWSPLTDLEALVERLAPLQKLLPGGKISRQLWVELLEATSVSNSCYGGLQAVEFRRAHGLVDDEALIMWSAAAETSPMSLVPPAQTRALNAQNFADGQLPARGWVESDPQRLCAARELAAQKLCPWVIAAQDDMRAQLDAQKQAYRWPQPQIGMQRLTNKQIVRRDLRQAFGVFDYALPSAVRLSCKAWENALTTPELAWYDALKLRPLWQAGQEDPSALWIGNWVHAALKNATSPTRALEFFATPPPSPGQLQWHQARAKAWAQVWGFARALELSGAKIEQTEWPLEGWLADKVFLNGRVDAWVRLSDDSGVVVDYKTSPSATPLSERKLETGDGLQLWLYGRLLFNQTQTPVGLCRLTFDRPLKAQLTVDATEHPVEARLKHIALTGVLGQRGWVWGRFGAQERLPLAALPMDWRVIAKRRKESYGTVE